MCHTTDAVKQVLSFPAACNGNGTDTACFAAGTWAFDKLSPNTRAEVQCLITMWHQMWWHIGDASMAPRAWQGSRQGPNPEDSSIAMWQDCFSSSGNQFPPPTSHPSPARKKKKILCAVCELAFLRDMYGMCSWRQWRDLMMEDYGNSLHL